MKIMMTEKWDYFEYVHYEVEELPEGWDEWGHDEKHKWIIDNGEYIAVEAEPFMQTEILDVEVQR